MTYQSRKFMIFPTTELPNLNFSEVLETSSDTVRKSVNGLKTFCKWDGDTVPPSVEAMAGKEGPYTYEEMIVILETEEWTEPNEML